MSFGTINEKICAHRHCRYQYSASEKPVAGPSGLRESFNVVTPEALVSD
jgi:hypothetical protein